MHLAMRRTFFFLAPLLFCLSGFAALVEPTQPCAMLVKELYIWGMTADESLQSFPAAELTHPVASFARSYHDVYVEADTLDTLAQKIALGRPIEEVRALAQRHAVGNRVPLTPLLPARIRDMLGTQSEKPCFEAAFEVREPKCWTAFDGSFGAYRDSHYTTLGDGDKFEFGDILLLHALRGEKRQPDMFHAAMYVGGDFFYHRISPDPRFSHEYIRAEDLFDYYTLQALEHQGIYFWGDQLFGQFLRWDPTKMLPQDRRLKNSIPNPLKFSERLKSIILANGLLSAPAQAPTSAPVRNKPNAFVPFGLRSRQTVIPPASSNSLCPCTSGKKYKNCHGRK